MVLRPRSIHQFITLVLPSSVQFQYATIFEWEQKSTCTGDGLAEALNVRPG